jgi:PAS domain S-box-containing protein
MHYLARAEPAPFSFGAASLSQPLVRRVTYQNGKNWQKGGAKATRNRALFQLSTEAPGKAVMSASPQVVSRPGASPELLSAAMERCSDALAIVSEGVFLWSNDAFARLFGYSSPRDLQEVELRALLPPGHACASGRAKARSGFADGCGFPACQFTARKGDGTTMQVESSCQWFHLRGERFLVMGARDISHAERRRVPREGAARYRAIFEASAIGIYQCTPAGYLVETNRALQQMLGYSQQELNGRHFSSITHPEDSGNDAALYAEVAAGKREYYQINQRYLRKGGSCGWGRLTISLVRAPSGEPLFTIGLVEDITEQKRIEQQLRESQRMETVGRLVGGISHDFNSLLTAIMLYCDLLLSGLEARSRARRHAEEIRAASERGAALVQQLLSFARQQAPSPQLLSVNELLQSMENMLRRLIGENIELSLALAADLDAVKADPSQIQQVVLNLVLNARDAMPNGGTLEIQTRPVDARTDEPGAPAYWVELKVRDSGSGMDEETRAHLFEPFFTTKRGRGSGLGLATVRSIVDGAGGQISVQSQVAHGTTVTVRFPASGVLPRESCSQTEAAKVAGRGETILLVEDDDAVRVAARRVLAGDGYKVLVASNGSEAIDKAQRHGGPIHLLLADMIMPGMSGAELVQKLRPLRPEMRALYISGYSDLTHLADNTDVLLFRKPFSGGALLAKIREVLTPGEEIV